MLPYEGRPSLSLLLNHSKGRVDTDSSFLGIYIPLSPDSLSCSFPEAKLRYRHQSRLLSISVILPTQPTPLKRSSLPPSPNCRRRHRVAGIAFPQFKYLCLGSHCMDFSSIGRSVEAGSRIAPSRSIFVHLCEDRRIFLSLNEMRSQDLAIPRPNVT
jgi:hypothetical protein